MDERKRKAKASTNGTAAGVKLGRTKGNEAENRVSGSGRERMRKQTKEPQKTGATKEAKGYRVSWREANEGGSGKEERES